MSMSMCLWLTSPCVCVAFFAWQVAELQRGLSALANEQSNPSLSPGVTNPLTYLMAPDYPDAKKEAGGCCVVA